MSPGVAWACLGAALAQVPNPEFPSQVELVTLDAVVVDQKGRPVLDLTRDEFVVKEDGVAQEIVSFERVGSDEDPLRRRAAVSGGDRGHRGQAGAQRSGLCVDRGRPGTGGARSQGHA